MALIFGDDTLQPGTRRPGDYSRHDASARLADAESAAHRQLSGELVDALRTDTKRIVSTPGFRQYARMTAAEVVEDMMAGRKGDAALHELLSIVGAAARGEDVRGRASAWIDARGAEHADYHAADAVEGG